MGCVPARSFPQLANEFQSKLEGADRSSEVRVLRSLLPSSARLALTTSLANHGVSWLLQEALNEMVEAAVAEFELLLNFAIYSSVAGAKLSQVRSTLAC